PSSWLRQWRSRYAIRAGRNLPDKEFRYLRMVIVTTAVYWRLSSELRLTANPSPSRSSTGQASVRIHRLATSHGPVFLVNSRFSLVSAAVPASTPLVCLTGRAPLLPKLRGHFAEFLNHDSLDRLGILYLTT